MLDLLVVGLERREDLLPILDRLGRGHRDYGVRPTDYELVVVSLLEALGDMLGDEFTDADRAAWSAAYEAIRDGMLAGAEAAER